MSQLQALITATEVKEYSVLGKDFPACDILFISAFEEKFFRDIFGFGDLYKDMLADLVDYSTAENFVQNTVYAVGALVKYNGKYYKKLTTGTTAPPNNLDWAIGEKFKSECFNNFYCRYLGTLLASHIVRSQIFLGIGKLTGQGLVKATGDNFDRMSSKDYSMYAGEIDSIIQTLYDNAAFNLNNNECLKAYVKITKGCGCEVEVETCPKNYSGDYNFC